MSLFPLCLRGLLQVLRLPPTVQRHDLPTLNWLYVWVNVTKCSCLSLCAAPLMNWQLVQDLIGWDSTLESLSTGEAVIKKKKKTKLIELYKLILGQFGSNETAIKTCLCLIYLSNSFFLPPLVAAVSNAKKWDWNWLNFATVYNVAVAVYHVSQCTNSRKTSDTTCTIGACHANHARHPAARPR